MRIVIVADLAADAPPRGGVQRSTSALATALVAAGHEVTVVAPCGLGTPTHDADRPYGVLRARHPGRAQILQGFARWTAEVRVALDRLEPDVVQGQGLLHNGIAVTAWEGCPRVVAAHGSPIADAHSHYLAPVGRLLLPLIRSTATKTIRAADAVTNVVAEWSVNCPVEPRRMEYIANPIEDAFFGGPEPPMVDRVLFLGGTRRIKGLDLLLKAWEVVHAALPDATLELFGIDETLAARSFPGLDLRPPGVVLRERLDPHGVAREMRRGGVVVLPSRFEVAPVVIAEAWAAGIGVVATAVGGVPQASCGAAHLCTPEPPSIAAALLKALTEPDSSMIAEGRRLAENHRAQRVAELHIRLYEELIG